MNYSNGRIEDRKWNKIFEDKHILDCLEKQKTFEISADEIREYREPRLMTKFDHLENLPDIFRKNNLGILPITRKKYVIGHFDAYGSFDKKPYQINNNIEVVFPNYIESIDAFDIHSEQQMIDIALISGMLQRLLEINDNTILFPTVNGRMSTGNISFIINGIPIDVKNSQMEIDAGFENTDSLIIIEAKTHQANTFLIRQLYYPYKVWSNRLNKKVIPIYLQYDNGIFNFSIFSFDDPNDYRSINLVCRKNFIVGCERITFDDLCDIYKVTQNKICEEPDFKKCPFPQADDLDKLLEIINCLLISKNEGVTKEHLSSKLDIVARQVNYYADAGKYLGIFNLSKNIISLTGVGREFNTKTNKGKLILLYSMILRHRPFRKVFVKAVQSQNKGISKENVITILKKDPSLINYYKEGVVGRRASTVRAWIKYIINSCDA